MYQHMRERISEIGYAFNTADMTSIKDHLGMPDDDPTAVVEGLDPEVESAVLAALDVYRSLGADVREIRLPHAKYAVAAYYLIASSEASSNLARYDGVHYGFRAEKFDDLIDMYAATRGEGFGEDLATALQRFHII